MKEKIKNFLVGKWNDILAIAGLIVLAVLLNIIENSVLLGDLSSQVIRLVWLFLPVVIFLSLLGGVIAGNRKIWRVFLLILYVILTLNTLTDDTFMIKFLYPSNDFYMPSVVHSY